MAQAKIMLNTFNHETDVRNWLGLWTCSRGPHDDQTFEWESLENYVLTAPVIRE